MASSTPRWYCAAADATRRALLLIALLFLIVLAARLPAAWAVRWLPATLSCESADVTVWNGHCATLRAGGRSLADLSWHVLPGELLRGSWV